jgi:hypothetical protein
MVDSPSVAISISIAVLLYDDRLVTVSVIAVPNEIPIAIPIRAARADCYTNRPDTDPNLFCSGWHCGANAG